MPNVTFKSLDDYESYLGRALNGWSPQQRLAFAAGMAERWLPLYTAFSAAEEWGDADGLRRSLDAVWAHLAGRRLSAADVARHRALLRDSTPHMDDFDALEALIACTILSDALGACGADHSQRHALSAGLSGFEAALDSEELDPSELPRVWRKLAAQRELKAQLQLIDEIASLQQFDAETLAGLRRRVAALAAVPEPAQPKPPPGPPPLTNQAAFGYYRRALEGRLQHPPPAALPPADPATAAIQYMGEWTLRYMARKQAFDGHYGRLADTTAWQALLARHRAQDAADTGVPDWDRLTAEVIELIYTGNRPTGLLDVASAGAPHGYGPSLRRLWVAARRQGLSGQQAAQHILNWAHARPAAWAVEDQRKQKGKAHADPRLGAALGRAVSWTATGDLDLPWLAEVDGQHWQARLNDFPDAFMYSLLIDGAVLGDFHDWPETWQRPEADVR